MQKPGASTPGFLFVPSEVSRKSNDFKVYLAERHLTAEFRLGSKRLAHSPRVDARNIEDVQEQPAIFGEGRRR
jgi:hypothetical protein